MQRVLFPALTATAAALMVASALLFAQVDDGAVGAVVAVVGLGVMAGAVLTANGPLRPAWTATTTGEPLRLRWLWLALGALLLLAFADVSGGLVLSHEQVSSHAQFGLLLGGIVALIVGGAGWRLRRSTWQPGTQTLALAGIVALALIVRLVHLESAFRYFIDEMNFARVTRLLADGHDAPLAAPFSSLTAFTWLYPYWQSFTFPLFDSPLMGLRVISVIVGVLGVVAIYGLARELFDRRAGLVAALLLAVYPPHVHFSRIGINNIADPLVGTLALFFLVRGLRTRRQSDFALAGIWLGLTQYFYEGGRVIFPLLVVGWLLVVALMRRVPVDGPLQRRLALMAAMAGLVAMPVYYTIAANQLPLLARFETAGLGGSYWQVLRDTDTAQTLSDHLTWPFLMFVHMAERWMFYGGETPLLLVFVAPFFLLGLAYAIVRLRHPGLALLVLWLLLVTAGNMLLANSAYAPRYVVAFPALILLVTVAICYVLALRPRWLDWLLRVAVLLVLVAGQIAYYFGPHLDDFNRQLRPRPDVQDSIFRAAHLPSDTHMC
ncbi:MAG: glycosyltransferase family 39 protein, partial [Phototrophicaceae bacterium]